MERLNRRRGWSLALTVVAVVLAVGASLCAFETGGGHHDSAGRDLCTTMIVAIFGPFDLLVVGVILGAPAEPRRWAATPVTVSGLDPPPRRVLSVRTA